MNPVRVFVLVAGIAGLAIALAMPPGAAPDETRHLSRVYLMSEGHFGVPGRNPPRLTIPKSIPDLHRAIEGENHLAPPRHSAGELAAFLAQPLDPARRVWIGNAGTYPPIVYLPQLIGVAPGRWLGLSPAALVYLGRLASLAAWLVVTALAIRLAPARQWTLVLLSLTPMSIASAASISADPMTNAATLLFAVAIARAAVGSGPLARTALRGLFGAALYVAAVKPGYWPLAAAAFAIPPARCGGSARRLALVAGLAATCLLPSLAWMAWAQRSGPAPPIAGADPVAQLGFVLGDPLGFAAILLSTVLNGALVYWTTFVGELGPLIVELPAAAYVLWAIALAAVLALDGPPLPLARAARGWLAVAFALSIAAMFTMAYLGWNPVGDPVIKGVQGRYWAPAVPLLAFALPATRQPLSQRARLAALGVAVVSLLAALVAVVSVYYRAG